jgi:hypothetical protein
VIDFKHFLEYARYGARAIAESFAPTGRDTESPFETGVKRAITAISPCPNLRVLHYSSSVTVSRTICLFAKSRIISSYVASPLRRKSALKKPSNAR